MSGRVKNTEASITGTGNKGEAARMDVKEDGDPVSRALKYRERTLTFTLGGMGAIRRL